MQLCSIIYYSLAALHVSSVIFAHLQDASKLYYSFWYYKRMSLPAGFVGVLELIFNTPTRPTGSDIRV